jgi:large subunit ribosomal protein L17
MPNSTPSPQLRRRRRPPAPDDGQPRASLFAAEAIVTTEAKAKALRPVAEKLITKAKKAQDGPMRVHRIRQIQGYLGDREMTHKLVNDVAPRYTERNGGYTRILKLGTREGDNADMARIELV